ncbi:MAG: serine/threonine protein kinase, partial [Deltaproteobacteria bacterium]|nr:serine/threonine protein kinase [Deltaproteobacteria bacterium]
MPGIGDKVGDYEIAAKLKSGGMATLYLGRRTGAAGFARHVAIKLVHPHLSEDPNFISMFIDEAKLSARIQHPNVVHVEQFGDEGGCYYLVMEYVHGCSLSQLLKGLGERKRRLTPDVAVSVAMKLAEGLHAAHETRGDDGELLGVVHRDVSPQNVLLAYKGHVKLIDFGIAKARGRSQETAAGLLKGKFRYMAPEQAAGRPVDRRSDLYALGIVLWEMLTGRRLFKADNDLLLLDMVRSPEVQPPSACAPGISPELDAVVMKALAPDVDARYASCAQFRRALAQAVPQAFLVDSERIAALLKTVMGDEIRSVQSDLPGSVSELVSESALRRSQGQAGTGAGTPPASTPPEAEEILHTMTLSADDLELLEADYPAGGASAASGTPSSVPTSPTGELSTPSSGPPMARLASGLVAIGLVAFVGGYFLFAGEEPPSEVDVPPEVVPVPVAAAVEAPPPVATT